MLRGKGAIRTARLRSRILAGGVQLQLRSAARRRQRSARIQHLEEERYAQDIDVQWRRDKDMKYECGHLHVKIVGTIWTL